MKILALGDVVGRRALDYLSRRLWRMRDTLGADLVIANGENTSEIHGLSAADADALLSTGVDVITLGNHAFSARDIGPFLDDHTDAIIRPANYPPACPGAGYTVRRVGGLRMLVMNLSGTVYMDPLNDPFATADRILEREAGEFDLAILDMHAEATSEKLAMGYHLDGRVSVVFGTHTHVPTADARILPHGTGYVTDLGMTGPTDGILGTATAAVLYRMRTHMPTRFTVAEGPIEAQGVVFTVEDTAPFRCVQVERISF